MEQPPNAVCNTVHEWLKNYRICPIRIEIIHGRHELFLNFTIADACTIVIIHYVERTLVSCYNLCPIQLL